MLEMFFVQEKSHTTLIVLLPELCRFSGIREELIGNSKMQKDILKFTGLTQKQRVKAMRVCLSKIHGEFLLIT